MLMGNATVHLGLGSIKGQIFKGMEHAVTMDILGTIHFRPKFHLHSFTFRVFT